MTQERESLLPNTSTKFERDLEMTGYFAGRPETAFNFSDIWCPHRCPVELLPWLAWTRDVEGFDNTWDEARKRNTIAAAPEINRLKGTVASVKKAMKAAGFGKIVLKERAGHWAEYEVEIENPLTNQQYKNAVEILIHTNPARNRLVRIEFTRAILHNNKILRNGEYLYGTK